MKEKITILLLSGVSLFGMNNYSYMIYNHGKYNKKNIDDVVLGFQQKEKTSNYAFELSFHERKSDFNPNGFYSIKTEIKNTLLGSRRKARLNYIFTNYNLNNVKYHYFSYYLSKYNYNLNYYSEFGSYITYSKEENGNLFDYNLIPYISYVNNLNNNLNFTNIFNIYFGNKINKKHSIFFKGIEYTGIINIKNNIIFNINLLLFGKINYLDKYIYNNIFYTIPLYNKLKTSFNFSIYKKINKNLLLFLKNNNSKYFKSSLHEYGVGLIYKY